MDWLPKHPLAVFTVVVLMLTAWGLFLVLCKRIGKMVLCGYSWAECSSSSYLESLDLEQLPQQPVVQQPALENPSGSSRPNPSRPRQQPPSSQLSAPQPTVPASRRNAQNQPVTGSSGNQRRRRVIQYTLTPVLDDIPPVYSRDRPRIDPPEYPGHEISENMAAASLSPPPPLYSVEDVAPTTLGEQDGQVSIPGAESPEPEPTRLSTL